jgi:hypothetical protein
VINRLRTGHPVLMSATMVVTGRRVHRIAGSLALAMCLVGCSTPVALLTGGGPGCSLSGQLVEGPLIPDPEYGTAIKVEKSGDVYSGTNPINGTIRPVMWPEGYTARHLGWEVEVLNEAGEVVATTGRKYALAIGALPREIAGVDPFPACMAEELKS